MNGFQDSDIGGACAVAFRPSTVSDDAAPGLPEQGRPWQEIRSELIDRKHSDYDWKGGRVPIYVYYDNEELLQVSREAYGLYFSENALGQRAFPSLATMESELIELSLRLFHAPTQGAGSFTSGGTESIFLAMKTARDYFRATHSTRVRPKVVLPRTAHPAFDKAGHYLDVEITRTEIGADLRGDPASLADALDERTMMIVGSAPCYPYGVYDPVEALGEIANSRGIWFHVDACLGGFLAPFAQDEGYPVPAFDFGVSGVTSLSADLHKYGFSARGASVVLYRSSTLKQHQPFHFSDWPRGSYSTDTFLGSRPGGAIASAWAVTQFLGRDGYRRLARKIMESKRQVIEGLERIQGIEVIRPSDLSIVLYRSTDPAVDIHAVAECLMQKGWFVGRSREPQALHLALNAVHAPVIGRYVADVRNAVLEVRTSGRVGRVDNQTY